MTLSWLGGPNATAGAALGGTAACLPVGRLARAASCPWHPAPGERPFGRGSGGLRHPVTPVLRASGCRVGRAERGPPTPPVGLEDSTHPTTPGLPCGPGAG